MGWITNIVALKMTFHPVEFHGIPPYLGWQGIVPRKATKIAREFSHLLTENLISIPDLFSRINPDQVAEEMQPAFDELIEPTLRKTVRDETPALWDLAPEWSRRQVYRYFRRRLSGIVSKHPNHDKLEFSEQTERLPATIETEIGEPFDQFVDEVMNDQSPSIWEFLPDRARNRILREVREELPRILAGTISDWQERVDQIFNLDTMVVEEIRRNRWILNDVFQKSGEEELKFIERSGLYFGTLFGCVQMILWMFFDFWWLLPVVGLLVGLTTNYIAIQLVFSPKDPIWIGPYKLQGLAYKRRDEINEIFSRITTDEVLNVPNLFKYFFRGTGRHELYEILQKQIHVAVDRMGGFLEPLITSLIGTDRYFEIKNEIANEMLLIMPDAMEYSYDYLEEELDLRTLLHENLESLNPHQYEEIMRKPYQEDEWLLVLVGGVLGAVVGGLQLIYLFGGQLPLPW
jgi:uncharacterized membrane protein YheB (UPF0754 family)